MQDFTKLGAWQSAYRLSLEVYRATQGFPQAEQYAMRRQIRNAAVSVAANIAEGCGRRTGRELCNFAGIASGSRSELQCLLLLARDLSYLDREITRGLIARIIQTRRMLAGLQQTLK